MLSQNIIIESINKYIRDNHLPLHFNQNGVCNGLSNVYAKYVFENREQEFREMLTTISNMLILKLDPESEQTKMQINDFIANVVLSMSPEQFDNSFNQLSGLNTLAINHSAHPSKRIEKPIFEMTMVQSVKSCAELLDELALEKGEVLRLNVLRHAVSVTRTEEDKYRLYDPNEKQGYQDFDSPEELIALLREEYYKSDSPFAMQIMLYQNPHLDEPRKKKLNSPTEYYKKYYIDNLKNGLNQKATSKFDTRLAPSYMVKALKQFLKVDFSRTKLYSFSPLMLAAMHRDTESFKWLIDSSKDDIDNLVSSLQIAIQFDNFEAANIILEKVKNDDEKIYTRILDDYFKDTIAFGSEDCFHGFQEHYEKKHGRSFFSVCSEEELRNLLHFIAAGKSHSENINQKKDSMMVDIFQEIKRTEIGKKLSDPSLILKVEIDKHNMLTRALSSGSLDNARWLFNNVKLSNYQLQQKHYVFLLKNACKSNETKKIDWLINEAKEAGYDNITQELSFSLAEFDSKNLNTIDCLLSHGYNLSYAEKATYKHKQGQRVTHFQKLGIQLTSFCDFVTKSFRKSLSFDMKHEIQNNQDEIHNNPDEIKEPSSIRKLGRC
jgi:hypothetical protein